jgi:hypothetical protein
VESLLAKYTEEEIIQLIRQNPGYGLLRMISELYPKKDGRQTRNRNRIAQDILIILEDHEKETGENLYDLIQSTDYSRMVTENDYLRITGSKNIPSGHGRRGSASGAKSNRDVRHKDTMIALPPQIFEWGAVEPAESRPSHIEKGFKPEYTILNLRFPFSKFWEMWMDGYSRGEISRELEIRYRTVQKWLNRMIIFDEQETLDEWLEVVELVTWFNEDRGLSSIEEERDDSVMLFIHSIVDAYLLSPEDEERPDLKELAIAYRFACEAIEED